ncbi:MAG: hypothetical protein IJH87_04955 [Atopobiaceae bacterium]|nr:hypothetical protein [Atopobiaceae bacterium]
MPENKINTAANRREKFIQFDRTMRAAENDLSDEERELLRRALKRRASDSTILSNNKILKAFFIGLPIAMIVFAILGMANTAHRRETVRLEQDTAAINRVVETWYSSWSFEDGVYTEYDRGRLGDVFAVGSTARSKANHSEGGEAITVFDLEAPTCLESVEVEPLRTREYRVTVHYYAYDGEVDQATWDALVEAGPKTSVYRMIVDPSSRVEDVQLIEE